MFTKTKEKETTKMFDIIQNHQIDLIETRESEDIFVNIVNKRCLQ